MQFMNFACPEFDLFTDSIIKFFIILLSKMNEVADPSMYFFAQPEKLRTDLKAIQHLHI